MSPAPSSDKAVAVTFPISFTNIYAITTANSNNNGYTSSNSTTHGYCISMAAAIDSVSITGFRYMHSIDSSYRKFYIAIGN